MRVRATAVCLGMACCVCFSAMAQERGEISGSVAYTDIIRFDYNKDGNRNRVQFWLQFAGKAEVGIEGQPGFVPADGAISYYLMDVDMNVKVTNWLMGFSMMPEAPPSGPYPMSNLVITGNRASFEGFNRKWEVVDGGTGFNRDTVTVDDGFRPKPMKMYGGDITVKGQGDAGR